MTDVQEYNNSSTSSPGQPCPVISVIIPLYNAEKYVRECIVSLLAQTFQNFEVIVVDDCSADNSFAIVESYAPKFSGRLILAKMEKNSGGGGLPRNKGLSISRGEYIFFLDADDMLTKTALEELYGLAKEYDADLIYIEKHYETNADRSEIHTRGRHRGGFVEVPTFESEDLTERLKSLLSGRFGVTPWIKFTKRNLLIENEIFFPHTCPGEDDIWTYSLIFYAKKLLRVPNAIYIQRLSESSVMRKERSPQQQLSFWINPLILGLKSFDKLIGKHEFFKSNPQYRYSVMAFFVNAVSNNILNRSTVVEPFVFYETIKESFGEKLGEYDVLIPALCTVLHNEKKFSKSVGKAVEVLSRKSQDDITARMDISLKGEGDFQIVSLSDAKINIRKPTWLNKNGIGYVVQSYAGIMEVVAKATVDGQLILNLRGLDIRMPEDKSKRIPYWIYYTKLIVNDKIVFDKTTPAWHDKPYRYKTEIKAEAEVKIQVEWLVHGSDT